MSNERAQHRRQQREGLRLESEDARLFAELARMPALELPDPEMTTNIWACEACGRPTVARNVNKGVTPMVLSCHAQVDLFDADGMPLPDTWVPDPDLVAQAGHLPDDELVSMGCDQPFAQAELFLALAHADPDRSARIQDAIAERVGDNPGQLAAFAIKIIEANAGHNLRCPGSAYSCFYNLPPEDAAPFAIVELLAEPPWEWYRPTTTAELRGLEGDMLHHLRQGGLLLRKRQGATGTAPGPDDVAPIAEDRSRWERFWDGLAGR